MQWGQDPSDETVATYADFVYQTSGVSEEPLRLTIAIAGKDDEALLARFLGCMMIGNMPHQGLHEVLESLTDMWSFYSQKMVGRPQLLAHNPRRIEATVVSHKKRPDMVISR
jgi:hypothetical protein